MANLRLRWLACALVCCVGAGGPAFAGLGGLPLPTTPSLPTLPGNPVGTVTDTAHNLGDGRLPRLPLLDIVGRPRGAEAFVRDPNGARAVRGQVLALSPSDEALVKATALHFEIVADDNLPALNLRLVTLRAPANLDTDAALAVLRASDPGGAYDYDHVYDPSGGALTIVGPATTLVAGSGGVSGAIGIIDAGILTKHPVLAAAHIVARNCVGAGASPATEHGTQIASLLVGDGNGFTGVAPGATLYAADVFGGVTTGGDAVAIARGLGWLADQNAVAINVSLVGPPNQILEAAVKGIIARGAAVIAAVGNDGAAGRVEYPAGYPGVIGVTAVDEANNVQIDANRGPDVMFAARGVNVRAAALSGRLATVTGTSYAAPQVTARLARELGRPDRAALRGAIERLKAEAIDLGAPGWDPVYGFGLIEANGRPMSARPVSSP
jgi:hypothetical protein